jgi:DNA ligase (NAD+)
VAVFNPVDIEGSTVERASLHNLSIMNELLGKPYIGQKVEIYKANMIIPNVLWGESYDATGVPESDIKFIGIPDSCPCCSEETVVKIEPKSGVRTLWCTNVDCDARGNRLLGHFVSRDAMNIDGISEATLNTLVQADIISDFVSIYHIKDYRDEIIDLEGFGVQSFNKMVNAIDKSRSVKLANLIYALGIPNVGLSTAKLICKNFKNDLAKTVTATYSDLVNIDGIGDVIAENFYNYFHTKENIDQFAALVKELQIVKEEISTNTSMAGTTICVTGDVYVFPNRRAIKDLVESLGGKLTGSVSKSTSYLVTNDTESGSNKNKAAKQYGIPILTEEQFIDKFNLRSYV